MLLCVPACDETTLFIDVRLAAGQAQPNALRLSLYHDGLLHRSTVPTAGKTLPGSLLVKNVQPGPALRVQLDGLDGAGKMIEQAASLADIKEKIENHLALTLGPPLADADGDGVPDVIDDCPELPDPDQLCAGSADLAKTPHDLAAPDAKIGGPCPSDSILCDDFESGDTSKWNPGLEAPKPEVLLQVDTMRPHGGTYALHTQVMLGTFTSTLNRSVEEDLATAVDPPFAVRMWVYNVDLLDDFTLFLVLWAGDNSYSIGGAGGGFWAMTEGTASNSIDHISSTMVPMGQWSCMEIVHDGSEVHVYTDGIERIVFAPVISGPITQLSLGMPRWPPHRDTELFFDDFVLAKSRVGCP
jgi:hypothetical protein